MGQAYEAAIFDFGGVLTTPIGESFASFERELGLPEGRLIEAFRHDGEQEPAFHLLEKGLITEAEFYARMAVRLREVTGIDLALPEDPGTLRRKMWGSLRTNDAMLQAAARIGRRYKTAVLSNNVKEWDWRRMIASHAFDVIVDSSEEGLRKPDPEIYLLACERLGVAPARTVFVDDIPSNVAGAEAVGMTAIRFTTTEEVLGSLSALFPLAFDDQERADA